MADKAKYIGTGRRKRSVARIVLSSPGSGKININGIDIEEYIPRESLITIIKQPLVALGKEAVYDVACRDGLKVNQISHRCPDNGAKVDLNDCSISKDKT